MANLMQLGAEFEDILTLIETNEGEITQEIEEKLAHAESLISSKVDNIGYYVRSKEKEIDLLKEFELSASGQRKTAETKLKNFKIWLAKAVRAFGTLDKNDVRILAGQIVRIKDISKNVAVLEDTLIEDTYRKIVITLDLTIDEFNKLNNKRGVLKTFLDAHRTNQVEMLDDKKIKAAVEAGEKVQGVGTQLKFNTQLLGLKKLEVANEI
jgi:hypothetical protein